MFSQKGQVIINMNTRLNSKTCLKFISEFFFHVTYIIHFQGFIDYSILPNFIFRVSRIVWRHHKGVSDQSTRLRIETLTIQISKIEKKCFFWISECWILKISLRWHVRIDHQNGQNMSERNFAKFFWIGRKGNKKQRAKTKTLLKRNCSDWSTNQNPERSLDIIEEGINTANVKK